MVTCHKFSIIWFALATAILSIAFATALHAHQMQVAISTVTFKQNATTIEVIHRFYTHDAEHAMSVLKGNRVDIIMYEEIRQQFGQHVVDNFQLVDQHKNEVPLSLVGVELDGHFIWVYQEATLSATIDKLIVINSSLLDLVPGQVNTVNIECGDQLSTLTTSGEIRVAEANIDFSACSEFAP